MRRSYLLPCVLAVTAGLLAAPKPTVAATLEEQRAAFRAAYPAAERGDWAPVEQRRSLLENYVLWPDLRAKYLLRKLSSQEDEVRQFLGTYGTLKPTRELRYRYSLKLAKDGRFADYLSI